MWRSSGKSQLKRPWYRRLWRQSSDVGPTAEIAFMADGPRSKMNEELKNLYLARALFDAVEDCNVQQVNILLSQNKANPNIIIPEEGITPFHLAAGHDNMAFGNVVTSLFLHNGGDPNVRSYGDQTVLHIGVAWNNLSVVETLLKNSFIAADPYLKDEDGMNAFNYAVKFSAWKVLTLLHSYVKQSNKMSNRVRFMEKSKCNEKDDSIENEAKMEIVNKKTVYSKFNKSDKSNRSSGNFNSSESVNDLSVSQINNAPSVFSSSDDTLSDILNKNIPIDHCYSDSSCDLSSHASFDESKLNSIHQLDNEIENLENICFPSENLLTDNELLKIDEVDEVDLTTERNNSSRSENNMCSINSEIMTDISGLSSYVCSDDYHTCPDTNSKPVLNRKNDKTDIKKKNLEKKVTGSFLNIKSDSIIDLPAKVKNLNISGNNSNPPEVEESSSLSSISEDYDTDYVRQSLRKYGCPPGPLVSSTKQLYVRKLNRIKKDESVFKKDDENIKIVTSGLYSCQLTKVLFDNTFDLWKETLNSWSYLERDIFCPKSGPSFTYLLLDPRITKNLPARAEKFENPLKVWQTFVSSIFYIGKGTNSRPNDHMMEAFNSWVGTSETRNFSQKTEYIINLWRENTGVVCVQAFHHLTLKEAHIREAAMIDAVGLDRLTNEKRGTYYDKTLRWRYSDRCKLGCYLLNRAMHVFLADGERQLKPIDLT